MAKFTRLTPSEIATIRTHAGHGMSERAISRLTGRSRTAVAAVLRPLSGRRALSKKGKGTKLSATGRRRLIRRARRGTRSARELRESLNLPISTRRVQQILQEDPMIHYTTMKKRPALSAGHRKARLEWARIQAVDDVRWWDRTVFSDEKRFCLDGPDGYRSYWADKRLPREVFHSRHSGGGGVMVWGCFCARGKGPLVFVKGGLGAVKYTEILTDILPTFMEEKYKGACRFQQDNASAHIAKHTDDWFITNGILQVDWPSLSPDLNPIENLWGILSRAVYANNRQFHSIDDLKECILYEWERIPFHVLKTLAKSVPKRIVKVIENRGGHIA